MADKVKKHLSFSAFMGYERCEARQKALDDGIFEFPTTQGMLEGKYLESILCQEPAPEGVLKKNGEPYAWAKGIEETAERMLQDNMITEYLNGKYQQQLDIKLDGVPWKVIPDIINHEKKRVIDIKKTQTFDPKWSDTYHTKVPFWTEWNYFLQLAVPAIHFGYDAFLIAATSESPGNFDIFQFRQEDMLLAIDDAKQTVKHKLAVRKGEIAPVPCAACDFCRSVKHVTEIKEARRFV